MEKVRSRKTDPKTAKECRRAAKECKEIAALEPDDDEKAHWLQRANEWEKQATELEGRQARGSGVPK